MRIGELSRRTGVSIRMLRYYDEQGLLSATRTGGGYREYDENAVDRVRCIRRLHSSALPTPVVRQVLSTLCGDPEATGPLLGVLERELAGLDERIDRLTASRSHLVGLIEDVRVRTRG
ncbi:MerR family transcriptional regulator [Allokutzneria albata]|uniref:DNA-binding transcriptional regulator, MerR family n=1 Tax=Allokutzneria albata TaxID=211114 RepID=A0A1G9WHL2_ALLAB|nr:MerR family transcriptional regulator [Allokutzneria albata]SDM83939.1 DNA-binding transcriptional regulator, MerR family [Allokutzneria albata]